MKCIEYGFINNLELNKLRITLKNKFENTSIRSQKCLKIKPIFINFNTLFIFSMCRDVGVHQ